MEKIGKNIDQRSEAQKISEQVDVERNNQEKKLEDLRVRFSEMIKQNPIIVYSQLDNYRESTNSKKFDKIERIRADRNGTNGVSISFGKDSWIGVGPKGVSASMDFEKRFNDKISEESYQNILTMINESLKVSGNNDVEREKMFQLVVDNFRDKIINNINVEKIEK